MRRNHNAINKSIKPLRVSEQDEDKIEPKDTNSCTLLAGSLKDLNFNASSNVFLKIPAITRNYAEIIYMTESSKEKVS